MRTTPEQLDAIEHRDLPAQVLHHPYDAAHADLERLGYDPVRIPRAARDCVLDVADMDTRIHDEDQLSAMQHTARQLCTAWPEIESCSTGADVCFFYWRRRRDGRLLVVETAGTAQRVADAWWARPHERCVGGVPIANVRTLPPADRGDHC